MKVWVQTSKNVHDVKKVLYRQLKRAQVKINNRIVTTKLLKNEQVIGFLINEDGKLYGTKITPLPDKTYQIDCYNGNNKKKSTIKIKKLDEDNI